MRYCNKFCHMCRKMTLGVKAEAHHAFHFVMTLLTCGLWLVVWLIAILIAMLTRSRCSECGVR